MASIIANHRIDFCVKPKLVPYAGCTVCHIFPRSTILPRKHPMDVVEWAWLISVFGLNSVERFSVHISTWIVLVSNDEKPMRSYGAPFVPYGFSISSRCSGLESINKIWLSIWFNVSEKPFIFTPTRCKDCHRICYNETCETNKHSAHSNPFCAFDVHTRTHSDWGVRVDMVCEQMNYNSIRCGKNGFHMFAVHMQLVAFNQICISLDA